MSEKKQKQKNKNKKTMSVHDVTGLLPERENCHTFNPSESSTQHFVLPTVIAPKWYNKTLERS